MAVVDRHGREPADVDERAMRARSRRVALIVAAVVVLLFVLPFVWKLWP